MESSATIISWSDKEMSDTWAAETHDNFIFSHYSGKLSGKQWGVVFWYVRISDKLKKKKKLWGEDESNPTVAGKSLCTNIAA